MALKTLNKILKQRTGRYKIPKTVRDVIPVEAVYEDGVFFSEGRYTKSWKLTDVNYETLSNENKKSFYFDYEDFINCFDSEGIYKETINKRRINTGELANNISMPLKDDGLDDLRKEHNDMLMNAAMGSNGSYVEMYVTVAVQKDSLEEARGYLSRSGDLLSRQLRHLGSRVTELDGNARLEILHDFYRPGESENFSSNLNDILGRGHDVRDFISPDFIERHSDYIQVGERYIRVFFVKDVANNMKDSLITKLLNVPSDMIISLDVISIPTGEAVKEAEKLVLGQEANITNWQRRQNQHGNFSALVPIDMENARAEARDFLNDLTSRDQKMKMGLLTFAIIADSKKQLDADSEAAKKVVETMSCQPAVLKYQQTEGLNTVLPIGSLEIEVFRTYTTECISIFVPFRVQEIQDKGGVYYGQNAVSKNLILCDRGRLMNQSAWILGVPGAGKSFSAKQLIMQLMLNTDDNILIIDPEDEYEPIINACSRGDSSIIHIAAGGKDRLNAMYMVDGYGEYDSIVVKSEFILSLVEAMSKPGVVVGAAHRSIIDRCLAAVYRESKYTGVVPTLSILRDKLLEQPEAEATETALILEAFTTGSLDIFGKGSNVDLDKRVVVFDIKSLGDALRAAGLLVITDTMLNRVSLNWKKGIRTHVFIDEVHVIFQNEHSSHFFNSAWRQFRKRNAYPTAITQNVTTLLESADATSMLSNSEFILMLNQGENDREGLANLLNISDEQMKYISDVEPGCGLIRYGSSLVPFINKFPKNTKLYELMTTKPGEGIFGNQNKMETST